MRWPNLRRSRRHWKNIEKYIFFPKCSSWLFQFWGHQTFAVQFQTKQLTYLWADLHTAGKLEKEQDFSENQGLWQRCLSQEIAKRENTVPKWSLGRADLYRKMKPHLKLNIKIAFVPLCYCNGLEIKKCNFPPPLGSTYTAQKAGFVILQPSSVSEAAATKKPKGSRYGGLHQGNANFWDFGAAEALSTRYSRRY